MVDVCLWYFVGYCFVCVGIVFGYVYCWLCYGWVGWDVVEVFGDFFFGGGQVDVVGQYQYCVVWVVLGVELGFYVIQ